ETKRRQTLKPFQQAADSLVGLTGTPAPNEVEEPRSILRWLSKEDEVFGKVGVRASVKELAKVYELTLLNEFVEVVRRRKSAMLQDLPPLTIDTSQGVPLTDELRAEVLKLHENAPAMRPKLEDKRTRKPKRKK